MTNEQIEYLKNIVKGRNVREIAELLNNKFNTHFSQNHISYIKNKYNIRSGPIATFKKGHDPLRYKPIGHERIKNGHVYIKKDRNRRNFALENLILVSQSEFLIMNDHHLYKENAELTETGALLARIIDKTNKLTKKN